MNTYAVVVNGEERVGEREREFCGGVAVTIIIMLMCYECGCAGELSRRNINDANRDPSLRIAGSGPK